MENITKKYSKCGEVKNIAFFGKQARSKDGYRGTCKCCGKHSYTVHREKILEYQKWYSATHREKVSAYQKLYRAANKEKLSLRIKRYYIENKEKLNAQGKQYREAKPEIGRQSKARQRSTPQGRLNHNIGTVIGRSLRGNKGGRHWEKLVGYSLGELKKHLEAQFKPGMTWENYGEWHVDHRIPLVAHCFETPEDIDFKRAWSLRNLRPLWATENVSKGARMEKPFQPSLMI